MPIPDQSPWPEASVASPIPALCKVLQEGEVLLPTERDTVLGGQSRLLSQISSCQMDGASTGSRPQACRGETD